MNTFYNFAIVKILTSFNVYFDDLKSMEINVK
jgi:hypothetical protein